MNDEHAERYVAAGQVLIGLGRWLQKTYPKPTIEGPQFDEAAALDSLLPESFGRYIDIGANHYSDCSNTWNFYKRGWRGLLIDPLPETWANILRHRPEDRLCPIAASDKAGFAKMKVCRSVSSLRPDWPIDSQGTVLVETMPLRDILMHYHFEDYSRALFCSIDVEGHEREVLEGIDWSIFQPRVICIEYRNYVGVDTSGSWRPILEAQYAIYSQNQLNQIWKLK